MLVAEIIWCINATHTVYTRNNDATVFQMGSLSRVTVHTSKVVMDDYILLDILNKNILLVNVLNTFIEKTSNSLRSYFYHFSVFSSRKKIRCVEDILTCDYMKEITSYKCYFQTLFRLLCQK